MSLNLAPRGRLLEKIRQQYVVLFVSMKERWMNLQAEIEVHRVLASAASCCHCAGSQTCSQLPLLLCGVQTLRDLTGRLHKEILAVRAQSAKASVGMVPLDLLSVPSTLSPLCFPCCLAVPPLCCVYRICRFCFVLAANRVQRVAGTMRKRRARTEEDEATA